MRTCGNQVSDGFTKISYYERLKRPNLFLFFWEKPRVNLISTFPILDNDLVTNMFYLSDLFITALKIWDQINPECDSIFLIIWSVTWTHDPNNYQSD